MGQWVSGSLIVSDLEIACSVWLSFDPQVQWRASTLWYVVCTTNMYTSPNCLNSPPIIWTSLTFAKYKDCFNFSRPFPDSIDWHIAVSSLWYWVVINTQLQIAKNSDNLVSWPSPPSSASPCQSRLISFNFDEMIKMRERWMERSESWEYCTTCITKAPGHPP